MSPTAPDSGLRNVLEAYMRAHGLTKHEELARILGVDRTLVSPVDYDTEPFPTPTNGRAAGKFRASCFGSAWIPSHRPAKSSRR